MTGWRVWFAFEVRPGIRSTRGSETHWSALAHSCRDAEGKIDPIEFDRWLTCFVENSHVWGEA